MKIRVRTDIEGLGYIKANKWYEVSNIRDYTNSSYGDIINSVGYKHSISFKHKTGCAYLNGHHWQYEITEAV